MKDIHLVRSIYEEKQTLGNLFVMDGTSILFQCKTLELPWKENQQNISCVPPGSYPILFEYSPAFQMNLWELKEVPNRSEIKIHQANYFNQLRGCIAIGDKHIFINNDQFKDLRNSRRTLERFHEAMGTQSMSYIYIYDSY